MKGLIIPVIDLRDILPDDLQILVDQQRNNISVDLENFSDSFTDTDTDDKEYEFFSKAVLLFLRIIDQLIENVFVRN